MNFNTNFRNCCCNRPKNCCWQNPCRPMPRPPKCGCHNNCWNCNPCCREIKWDNCRQDWGRNDQGRAFQDFEENNFDSFNYYPEDFGQKEEQFERFDRNDDFERFDDFDKQPFKKDDRRNCNNGQNNCNHNCCFSKNACCLLAGCILGRCCK